MITNSHALPSPLRVPSWSHGFEKRHHINYIRVALCSCTIILVLLSQPTRAPLQAISQLRGWLHAIFQLARLSAPNSQPAFKSSPLGLGMIEQGVTNLGFQKLARMSAALTKAPIKSAINPKLEPANVPTKLALPWGNAAN